MQNIHNIIEIKRGLHKICGREIIDTIAKLDKCEDFYHDVFLTYGLTYNTETISQKESFICATTKYFILDRLPKYSIYLNEGIYETNNKKELKKLLEKVFDVFYSLKDESESIDDFKKKYAKHFNEDVMNFSKEISENREDSLSDFAKAIQKVYYSKDKDDNC